MQQCHDRVSVTTSGPGLYDISHDVLGVLSQSGLESGLMTLLVQHTSASLVIQENADPDVQHDLQQLLARLVSRDQSLYRHTMEGPDDMPAHIRSALTQTSLSIPFVDGRFRLGTWQGLYLFEHRDAPHQRRIAVHMIGV